MCKLIFIKNIAQASLNVCTSICMFVCSMLYLSEKFVSSSSVKPPYTSFVVSRAFMAGAASQAGDADSSWAPGLTSGLQGSVNRECPPW